jgi:hypothetical protein
MKSTVSMNGLTKYDEYVLPNIEWHHNHNKSTACVRQAGTRYLLKISIQPQGTKIKSLLRLLGELREAEHRPNHGVLYFQNAVRFTVHAKCNFLVHPALVYVLCCVPENAGVNKTRVNIKKTGNVSINVKIDARSRNHRCRVRATSSLRYQTCNAYDPYCHR